MRINLGVLPWASLDSPLTLGRVTYIPWSQHREQVQDAALQDHIDKFLSVFKSHGIMEDGSLAKVDPAIVLIDGNIDIQPDQQELFFRTINLLFFLVTSWDNMTYINNNAFEGFIQPLETGKFNYVFGPLRSLTIADFTEITITQPTNALGISRAFGIVRNKSYVQALERLQTSRKYGRIVDASLSFYRLAHDDHYAMNDYLKLGFLISAFETLFGGVSRKETVILEIEKQAISKKRMVVFDRSQKKRRGLSRAAGVVFKAYDSRNGYLHNGEQRGLGVKLDGENLSLWSLTAYAYEQCLLKRLEDWKILKWDKFERYFLWDSRFDSRVKTIVEKARSRREYINKKMEKERAQRKGK